MDPTVSIVLRIDATKVEPEDDGRPPRSHALLGGPGVDAVREVVCRYFDPRDERSPTDCQVPITVVFDGRRYRALEPTVAKAGPAGLRFLPSDVAPGGPLADIDPRLGDVDPMAYIIDGVPPTDAIVVVLRAGVAAALLPFIAEGGGAIPGSLCRFLDVSDPDTAEAPAPVGCKPADTTAARAMIDRLRQQEETWSAQAVGSYILTIDVRCACPPAARGPFTVTVRGGDVVAQVRAGGQTLAEEDPRLAWAPLRVQDMFEAIWRFVRVEDLAAGTTRTSATRSRS